MSQPLQTPRFKEALARVQLLFTETHGLKLTTADAAADGRPRHAGVRGIASEPHRNGVSRTAPGRRVRPQVVGLALNRRPWRKQLRTQHGINERHHQAARQRQGLRVHPGGRRLRVPSFTIPPASRPLSMTCVKGRRSRSIWGRGQRGREARTSGPPEREGVRASA